MKKILLTFVLFLCVAGVSACNENSNSQQTTEEVSVSEETNEEIAESLREEALQRAQEEQKDLEEQKKQEAMDEQQTSQEQETQNSDQATQESPISNEELYRQFHEKYYAGMTDEEIEAAVIAGNEDYRASSYYSEITDYWENVRGVTDISNTIDPLYYTDMRYYTAEDFADDPAVVIHLAKNEIYARHGYIFKNKDLNHYFLGCAWYHPLVSAEDFDDSVFNEYEVANLKVLSALDQ